MTDAFTDTFGTVLLRCRWRRVLSGMMVGVSLTIALLSVYALFVDPPRDVRDRLWLELVLGVLALVGAVAFVASLRALVHPPVLFEVTDRGIVLHRDGGYLEQAGVDSQGERTTVKTIAVGVRADDGWSPAQQLRDSVDASGLRVPLDAFTGTPHGRDLLRRIEAIRSARSPSTRGRR